MSLRSLRILPPRLCLQPGVGTIKYKVCGLSKETPGTSQSGLVVPACRLNLIRAVEGDDWSAVIDAQTAETTPVPGAGPAADADASAAAAAPASPIESPFSRVNVHRSIGEPQKILRRAGTPRAAGPAMVGRCLQSLSMLLDQQWSGSASCTSSTGSAGPQCKCWVPNAGNAEAAQSVAMTVEAVDRALDEVRPYLIADGGNVTVLDVVDGTVMLQLDVSPSLLLVNAAM